MEYLKFGVDLVSEKHSSHGLDSQIICPLVGNNSLIKVPAPLIKSDWFKCGIDAALTF